MEPQRKSSPISLASTPSMGRLVASLDRVACERARGKRMLGQTAGVGFQIGVQRTIATTADKVWRLIEAQPELWLGEGASVALEEGDRYEVAATRSGPGVRGEIRVVKPALRLRMTWQPDGWTRPATLQLTLLESGPKTAVHAHMEKLPDADAREAMRTRLRDALDRIARPQERRRARRCRSAYGAGRGRTGRSRPGSACGCSRVRRPFRSRPGRTCRGCRRPRRSRASGRRSGSAGHPQG